jgi:hypothetical protein
MELVQYFGLNGCAPRQSAAKFSLEPLPLCVLALTYIRVYSCAFVVKFLSLRNLSLIQNYSPDHRHQLLKQSCLPLSPSARAVIHKQRSAQSGR